MNIASRREKPRSLILVRTIGRRMPVMFVLIAVLPALFAIQPCSSGFSGIAWAKENAMFRDTPEQAKGELERCFQNAETFLARNDIQSTRQEASLIAFKMDKYKKKLNRGTMEAFKKRLDRLNGSVMGKIDSLVQVNLKLIDTGGRAAGYEFRQYLSVQLGLSETELAPIDEAIVEKDMYADDRPRREVRREPASAETTSVTRGEPGQTASIPPTGDYFSDTVHAVPIQGNRSESALNELPAVVAAPPPGQASPTEDFETGKATAAAAAAKVRVLIGEGKTDEAMTVFRVYQINMQRFLDSRTYESVKGAIDAASSYDQDQRSRALDQSRTIELLMDQGRITEAFTDLSKTREWLRRYLDRESLKYLEKKVGQAYVDFLRTQVAANRTMQTIRRLVTDKKAGEAFSEFEKSREKLERGLTKEAFENLRKEVAAAYGVMRDEKKRAEWHRREITSLIKAGNRLAAYSRFSENRLLLEENLDAKSFKTLETEAIRANRYFKKFQKRAHSVAARIDSFLGRGETEHAYGLFEETKKLLRRDLADDNRYFEQKARVTKAYDELCGKRKQAGRISREIAYLADREEGGRAFILFRQESRLLKEYLQPDEFVTVENRATLANAEFQVKRQTALSAVSAIGKLLDEKKIERAHALFRETEDDLEFHLEGDAALKTLRKRVQKDYDAFMEKKRWASSFDRKLRGLVKARRGNVAYEQFQGARGELSGYIDTKTLSSLEADVTRANGEYQAARDRAKREASFVRALLDRKQVEDAFSAFDTLKAGLEFYLDPAAFTTLKADVERSNGALQTRKKEALRIIGLVNGLIGRNEGDSASGIFQKNDSFLVKYLNPQTYGGVRERASRAKTEYAKQCGQARILAGKLQAKMKRNSPLDAYTEFDDNREYLSHYLDRESFGRLEAGVTAAYNGFGEKRDNARAIVASLQRMIRQHRGVEANAEFERRDTILSRYLPAREYVDILAKVTQSYHSSVRGRKDARAAAVSIRRILARGRVSDAYRAFQDARPTLELYMPRANLAILRSEVTHAHDEQEKKVKQAKAYAKKLRQLVAKKRISEAYRGFRMNRVTLSDYLDAQSFAELETEVMGAHDKAGSKGRNRGKPSKR